MELSNEFEVEAPVDQVWAVLTDLERIAPCLPGAQLQEIEGDEFRGVVKVKVGPITAQYKGAARFVERDDAACRAVLRAEGRDTRGAGNASADITASLDATDLGTKVSVGTELTVTGKVAQFGRGVMADVSKKLMGQFAENLSELIASSDALPSSGSGSSSEQESDNGAETLGSPSADLPVNVPSEVRMVDAPEVDAVDLLETAGAPLLKRLIPTVVGLIVLVVVILVLV